MDIATVNRTEVDGVPTFWSEVPGPLRAALMFRVGYADETLPIRGITHLVEHLALFPLGQAPYGYNGVVEPTRTVLYAAGDADDLVAFFDVATRSLVDLPFERLDGEKRILLTEAASRSDGPVDNLLAWRFGARGFGLSSLPELGLRWLPPEHVAGWSRQWFSRANAALWISGEIPAGMRLHLNDGVGPPADPPPPIIDQLPAWFARPSSTIAVSWLAQRATVAPALVRILERMLRQRLRYDEGISYHVGGGYSPLTGSLAHGVLLADVLGEHAERGLQLLLGTLDEFVATGPTPHEFDMDLHAARRMWAEPQSATMRLDAAASASIYRRPELQEDWLEELERLTPDHLRAALDEARESMLYLLPAPLKMPVGAPVAPVPEWSTTRVTGKRLAPVPGAAPPKQRLVAANDGLTLVGEHGELVTIRFDQSPAAVAWPNGTRALWGNDGLFLKVDPNAWWDGDVAVAAVDANLPPTRLVTLPEPDAAALPVNRRMPPSLRWVIVVASLVATLVAVGVITRDATPDGSDGTGVAVWVVLIGTAISYVMARDLIKHR